MKCLYSIYSVIGLIYGQNKINTTTVGTQFRIHTTVSSEYTGGSVLHYNTGRKLIFNELKDETFDNVRRNKLRNIVDRKGIRKHLTDVIKNIYIGTEIIIKT